MYNSKQSVNHAGSSPNSNNNNRSSPASTASLAHDAALTGAAKAFINGLPREELIRYVNGHSKPKPKPIVPGGRSRTASLDSIASNLSTTSNQSARPNQPRQNLVSDQRGHDSALGNHRVPSGGRRLPVPPCRSRNASQSPSNIAAVLATARAPPASPSASPTGAESGLKTTYLASLPRTESASSQLAAPTDQLDETPIPPTTSLVKLFEQNKSSEEEPRTPPVISSKPASIQSPKPIRTSQIWDPQLTALLPPNTEQLVHDRLAAKGLLPESRHIDNPAEDSDASVDSFRSAKEAMSPTKTSKPPLPLARRKAKHEASNTKSEDAAKPDIQLQPPSRDVSTSAPLDIRRPSTSRDVSTSAPLDIRRPSTSRVSSFHASPNSHPSITAAYHQLHPRRVTPLTTGDSLANAIVASSLASSRAPSPHKIPPQSSGRTKTGSFSHSLFSRTPSPPKKGMRQTLRGSSSTSSESEEVPFGKHKKKKKFIRKHPNKHHEGDRKRWRDAITERERKRYEGVWAANRGLHMFFTPEEQDFLNRHPHGAHPDTLRDSIAEQVTNVVTRDIWSRSRLSGDILEQVWDLVDTQVNGRLLKEEFVVGLWLVDQCLKGRKLPVRVTDSVWNSVRLIQGIKVRNK